MVREALGLHPRKDALALRRLLALLEIAYLIPGLFVRRRCMKRSGLAAGEGEDEEYEEENKNE